MKAINIITGGAQCIYVYKSSYLHSRFSKVHGVREVKFSLGWLQVVLVGWERPFQLYALFSWHSNIPMNQGLIIPDSYKTQEATCKYGDRSCDKQSITAWATHILEHYMRGVEICLESFVKLHWCKQIM